ncbi:2-hydroxy-3-oxopropionate reductase [Calidifontibacter sp. DB0510]|uniref:2-hydroxy-3-oxopropionate reductase n=1 Tax=Metallococcus carri TaxID=1656884 RepID=A0A967EA02_9MICO|nr:2-hydroxy-3-oxopropionate reductase [Metallococcus carri]NHN56942.1 2-hydroxy-3-oxopropionate reductase [Metallococcus carri]NOP37687.1 2-hydroxy-3-oxopropionate reductase [Calidifontibacter sp. DB2511S]
MADSKPSIAVIGLGIMGGPMAANLVKAGYSVTGYNLHADKVQQLVDAGGKGADSIADAVKDADVIITMVPDSPDVETVALGEDGLIAHATKGALWIDTSSIRPDVAVEVAKQATDAGLEALDAPVSGGEKGAIEATLSIMVGGEPAAFERAKPVLDAVGGTVVHVGPSGSGQTVKAANQLIVAGTIELVAEALVFLEAYGVDTDAAIKVLAGGLAGNRILDNKAASMVAREFNPGFRVDLHHKDMGIVTSAAREAGVAIPLGAVTAQLMGSLRQLGHGDLDHSALLLLVEQLSGRTKDTD